jgi:hypothetical protein
MVSELTLSGIHVVGDELGDETVLGRNVLNRLRLLLDGPREGMTLLGAGSTSAPGVIRAAVDLAKAVWFPASDVRDIFHRGVRSMLTLHP